MTDNDDDLGAYARRLKETAEARKRAEADAAERNRKAVVERLSATADLIEKTLSEAAAQIAREDLRLQIKRIVHSEIPTEFRFRIENASGPIKRSLTYAFESHGPTVRISRLADLDAKEGSMIEAIEHKDLKKETIYRYVRLAMAGQAGVPPDSV